MAVPKRFKSYRHVARDGHLSLPLHLVMQQTDGVCACSVSCYPCFVYVFVLVFILQNLFSLMRNCVEGCMYLRERLYEGAFSRKRLLERMQCFASEMGKTHPLAYCLPGSRIGCVYILAHLLRRCTRLLMVVPSRHQSAMCHIMSYEDR